MPTYEYECGSCNHHFEQFQQMSADPIKVCPECGKKKVRRLIGTGAALIFKGSGFYATDYRSDSYKEGAKKDTAPTPSPCDTCKKDSGPCPKAKPKKV
jgi:putative FmdB family regulatory protein